MSKAQINARVDREEDASAQEAACFRVAESGPGIYQRALAEMGGLPRPHRDAA